MSHSIVATALPGTSPSAKRSAPEGAARRTKSPSAEPRTLTAMRPACRMRCQVMESRDAQNETSGGRSETAANELTISPSGVPSTSVVTKATPVAKRPKAARRLRSSRPGSAGSIAWAGGIGLVQGVLAAERDVAEELVGAVGAERVHEAACADVAVRAREWMAVEVAGAARQGQRPVDNAHRGLGHERLSGLRVGEQRDDMPVGVVGERGGP